MGKPSLALDYQFAIIDAFLETTDDERMRGREFWPTAHAICQALAREYAQPLRVTCGVMAALSPNNSWKSNRESCRRVLEGKTRGIHSYGRDVEKAREIMRGADVESVLRGPKTTAFYRLMLDGGNARDVCVDGHMANLVRGEHRPLKAMKLSRGEFDEIAEAFRAAAGKLSGWWACELQAALWLAWRASGGLRQGRLELAG